MKIPQHFLRQSLPHSLAFMLYACLFILVPGYLGLMLIESGYPFWIKAVGLLFTSALAGQGYILLGVVAHDGYHFSLHRNRFVSCLMGTLCAAPIPMYSAAGFAPQHRNHHRFTNGPDDPDCAIMSRYRNALSRTLFQKAAIMRVFARNVILMALGRELPYRMPRFPLPVRQVVLLARIDIVAGLLFLVFYAWLAVVYWEAALAFVILPYVVGAMVDGPRAYIEHGATQEHELLHSRTRKSRIATLLYGGLNYHLEHHLYPGVPGWRLHKLHDYLVSRNRYAGQEVHIEKSFFKGYRYVLAKYAYPSHSTSDISPEHPSSERKAAARG